MNTKRAFTLIELIIVIAIIAVLAGILLPVFSSVLKNGDRAHALGNFRSLAVGMGTYAAEHNLELPAEGEDQPSWESAALPESADAWYNAIPRLARNKALADFAEQPDAFYEKANLLFIPAATYPNKEERSKRPLFAVSMNSKLRSKDLSDRAVRLVNMQKPARTVIFQEAGVPGEDPLPGQIAGKYDGQTKSFANRTVARYAGKTHLVFGDGHVECLDAKKVVAPDGKAFFPQMNGQGGEVIWTLDPEADANK